MALSTVSGILQRIGMGKLNLGACSCQLRAWIGQRALERGVFEDRAGIHEELQHVRAPAALMDRLEVAPQRRRAQALGLRLHARQASSRAS